MQSDTELIFLDRRDDPISPLVLNWGYCPLVDELIGLTRGTVRMPGVSGESFIFSRETEDDFLDHHWSSNFGDVSKGLSEIM